MLRHTPTGLALILLAATATPGHAADEAPKRDSLGKVNAVAYSPNGRTLATGSGSASERGTLVLWDLLTGRARVWLPQSLGVRSVAFSPDGEKIAAGGWDNLIRIYETRTAKLLTTLKGHEAVVNSLAFSPDGKILASCGLDKTVILWDPVKGAERHRLTGHTDWVLSLAFFPDGKSLASAGKDGTVRIWDVATGKESRTLKDATAPSPIETLAISPDGKTIATGSWDWRIYLWAVDKGAIRSVLRGHNLGVLSLTFSPDGKTLASVSGNSTKPLPGDVRLWTMPDGDEKATWAGGHTDAIWSVRFAPDGRTLATAGQDQKIRIWETATGKERTTLENGLLLFEAKPPAALTEKELDEIWGALADSDGAAAQLAIGRLARAPDQAPSWLAKRLKPAPKADAQQEKSVRDWIVKLDDDDFDTREKAAEELAKLGATAGPAMRKTLDETSSAEVRQRLNGLLEKMGKSGSHPEELRGVRAIEALELINTDAARDLLKGLAEGAAEASLTREAAASCRRMAKRP
jgi:dipeptidyl aminopeptidase/acylaminoacyl peptidase